MPSLLHDDLFIYSISMSGGIGGPQGVIGSIVLDTCSFTEARNCLAKSVVSQRLLRVPTGLSGFCQGFQVECFLWSITRTAV